MKKEYSEGENPFANFSTTFFSVNGQTYNNEVWAIESNLIEEFCNRQILQYDEETQAHKVNAFINEIRMNLSQASSMEDLLLVKRKINALDFYNKSCEAPKSNITYAVKQLIEAVKEKEIMIN